MKQVDWSKASETTLVEAASAGDPSAFDVLARRYRHPAQALARQIVGSRELADDVAQDALLMAFKSLPQLKEPDRFASWLGAIVRHRARRVAQHPERRMLRLDEVLLAYMPSIESQGAIQSEVACAIASLPLEQRSTAELYYLDEWSTAEIAEFLELPVTTVKWRLHCARQLLRPRLASLRRMNE
jgi:RNA polymerase sigma-70 factor (ECF subfamily)